MLVGYARVSTDGQNLDRQIDALKAVGVDSRVLYQEKITGTKSCPIMTRKMPLTLRTMWSICNT